MNYELTTAANMAPINTMAPIGPRLSGVALVPAGPCQVAGEIGPEDVLKVDFDADHVDRDGLYLVEAVTHDGVDWMGCRRFARSVLGEVAMFEAGQWVAPAGLRVAGRVVRVFKPA
jgi:hypothetical protein